MKFVTYSQIKKECKAKDKLNGYVVNVLAVRSLRNNYFKVANFYMRGNVLTIVEKPKLIIQN